MKKTLSFLGALCLAGSLVGASGCDKKDAGGGAGGGGAKSSAVKASCSNIKNLSTCTEYTDEAFALGEGFVKGACEATSGTYATTPCPTDKALGTCDMKGGQKKKYYADGSLAYKADDAAKDCKDLSMGTWSGK